MSRLERGLRRWKLALDRQLAVGRRKRSAEYQQAARWVAAWGFWVMAAKGIERMPSRQERAEARRVFIDPTHPDFGH